jgi:hypothetical protein
MEMDRRRLLGLVGAGAATLATNRHADAATTALTGHGPVIYSTDLNHPNGDLDDHLDLAVMHALGVDVRLLVLDRHPRLFPGDGRPAAAQMEAITGTSWRTVDGLADPFPTLQRPAPTPLIGTLRNATEPVTIVAVGSLRDVAAAYNSDHILFREKVARVVVFAGDASAPGFVEMNVWLDPYAFLTVMTSGVAIRWVPCFDGGLWQPGTRSSFVQYPYPDVIPADLDPRLLRFFAYRLHASTADPIAWLHEPVTDADRAVMSTGVRNLWCAGLLGTVIGDGVMRHNGTPVGVFEPVTARFSIAGALDPAGPFEASVDQWRVLDQAGWRAAMLGHTVAALRSIGSTASPRSGTLSNRPR